MKKLTKLLCLLLALVMVGSVLSACSGGGAGDDTTFTWWIYSGADASYYLDYQ